MRVSLLGTISASTDEGPAAVSGDKQQTLLAALALAAPRSVSDDRLIDELWGDAAAQERRPTPSRPRSPRFDERSDVTLCTRASNGYVLAVQPADVDALRLEQLVHQARGAAAAERSP